MIKLMIVAVLAAQISPSPLTPLTQREMDQYSGAGCTIQQNGRVVFITDMSAGVVRIKDTLRKFKVEGLFDPKRAEMSQERLMDDPPLTILIVRRPGAVKRGVEETVTPVRVTVRGFDRAENPHYGVFDAEISCYA